MSLLRCIHICIISVLFLLLSACATEQARLVQGKQDFITGDYHRSFVQLQPLAIQGNADAQYALGYMYYYGLGVPQNNTIAIKWLESAAAQNQPKAKQALNMILSDNIGSPAATSNPTFTATPPNYAEDVAEAMASNN